jgi:hypothetical protein
VLASNVGAKKKITRDVEKQTADLPKAQALVRREYRAGWEVSPRDYFVAGNSRICTRRNATTVAASCCCRAIEPFW